MALARLSLPTGIFTLFVLADFVLDVLVLWFILLF